MTRSRRLKLAYVAVILAASAAVALVGVAVGGLRGIAAALVLLLLPGRVQGYFYRDFFRGRRLLEEGRLLECIPHFERFIAAVRARPWLKRLLWLQFAVYTTDIEAMALNNLGSAYVELGDPESAERYLDQALRIDGRYPVALYNLSLVAALRGDRATAERLIKEAADLGYSRGGIDALLQRAGAQLARIEGR